MWQGPGQAPNSMPLPSKPQGSKQPSQARCVWHAARRHLPEQRALRAPPPKAQWEESQCRCHQLWPMWDPTQVFPIPISCPSVFPPQALKCLSSYNGESSRKWKRKAPEMSIMNVHFFLSSCHGWWKMDSVLSLRLPSYFWILEKPKELHKVTLLAPRNLASERKKESREHFIHSCDWPEPATVNRGVSSVGPGQWSHVFTSVCQILKAMTVCCFCFLTKKKKMCAFSFQVILHPTPNSPKQSEWHKMTVSKNCPDQDLKIKLAVRMDKPQNMKHSG